MSVPALPVLGAAIGRDWEGMCLIIKAFPVFVLASPSFVGFLSAYSAAGCRIREGRAILGQGLPY
eukprot:3890153-Prymnesium_polylepis.1